MTAGEIVYKITGDASGLKKSLDNTDKSVKKTGKAFSGLKKLIGAAFAAATIKKIADFSKKLVEAASAAEEISNKFGVTFSSNIEQANQAAQDLATGFGLATTEAKKLLSNTGDLLSGFGFTQDEALKTSIAVNELAADLASYNDVPVEQASQAITKSLLGEREALKSLGIVVSEAAVKQELLARGQEKLTGNALLQAKAEATLKIAYSQSQNALGDYARSSDSYANISKRLNSEIQNLYEELGAELIPAYKNLKIAILNTIEADGFFVQSLRLVGKGVSLVVNTLAQFIASLDVIKEYQGFKKQEKDAKAVQKEYGKLEKSAIKYLESQNILLEKGKKPWAEIGKLARNGDKTAQEYSDTLKNLSSESQKAVDNLNDPLERIQASQERFNELLKETEGDIKNVSNAARNSGQEFDEMGNAGVNAANDIGNNFIGLGFDVEGKIKDIASTTVEVLNASLSAFTDYFSALNSLQQAQFDQQIARLDEELQKELEAAGVAEETQVQKYQNELDAAIATGDAEQIADAEKNLKRAKIEEKYQKKKAKLEYEAAVASWEIQKSLAMIQMFQAPLNAFVSALQIPQVGPFIAPVLAAAALAAAATQYQAVEAAQPVKPKFATGGIVPGSSFSGDNVDIKANSGEMVLNEAQQGELFKVANGQGGGKTTNITPPTIEEFFAFITQAIQDGQILVFREDLS